MGHCLHQFDKEASGRRFRAVPLWGLASAKLIDLKAFLPPSQVHKDYVHRLSLAWVRGIRMIGVGLGLD